MPSTEVSPLQTVQDRVKEKIRAEFINLIPEEMWSEMVASVVQDFITDKQPTDWNGRPDLSKPKVMSPLKQIIHDELEGLAKAALKFKIDQLGQAYWDQTGTTAASEAIKKLVTENFDALLAGVQTGLVKMTVLTAINEIRNTMR